MIRIVLPPHLRTLAKVGSEVTIEVTGQVTTASILDAIETQFPVLKGTIREYETLKRRPFLRFFACNEDVTFEPPDAPLPDAIASGNEPFLIVGAVAGG